MHTSVVRNRADDLLTLLRSSEIEVDEDRVVTALERAQEIYGSMMHWTNMPLIQHCLDVLHILLPFHPDEETIIACILHHVLDNEEYPEKALRDEWGIAVTSIISGVTLLGPVNTRNTTVSIDQLKTMLLEVSGDLRILLLLLCGRSHVVEHLSHLPLDEQRKICKDILTLYSPIAARMGIYALKHHLEDRAFAIAHPIDYERISEQLNEVHHHRGAFLDETARSLVKFFCTHGLTADIEGREKHPFSIFTKLKRKSLTHVEDLYDLFALRVILPSIESCYQSLGLLHRMAHPVPGRFKDFIAFPKPNGYQSLHTTVTGLPSVPEGVFIEVQLRTDQMHREAELGIAAHWGYKEGGSVERAARLVRLQKMLLKQEPLEETAYSGGIFTDHIFVLTPKGDVVELPEGATPLDFAFKVHTDVGLSFRSAKVNGSVVPMEYQLENGDVIEILKYNVPQPSPRWMRLLKTASAQSKLRRFLVEKDRPLFIAKGREILNETLRKLNHPPLDTGLTLLKKMGRSTLSADMREDVLMRVGRGTLKPHSLLHKIPAVKESLEKESASLTTFHSHESHAQLVTVKVLEGLPMPIEYARCCHPQKDVGCDILGVVTRTGQVKVHRCTCSFLKNVNPERRMDVRWHASPSS